MWPRPSRCGPACFASFTHSGSPMWLKTPTSEVQNPDKCGSKPIPVWLKTPTIQTVSTEGATMTEEEIQSEIDYENEAAQRRGGYAATSAERGLADPDGAGGLRVGAGNGTVPRQLPDFFGNDVAAWDGAFDGDRADLCQRTAAGRDGRHPESSRAAHETSSAELRINSHNLA